VLVTPLHACGCYLAQVPTSNLGYDSWPLDWPGEWQEIFGEKLPGQLLLKERSPAGRLVVTIRGDTHRVKALAFRANEVKVDPATRIVTMELLPMTALSQLPVTGGTESFFEKSGWRKGYVRDSHKPLERILMSWGALDLHVGADKALGSPEETGVIFYTSLKFWHRRQSNIWNFPEFLRYWGWRLPAYADEITGE